jgi:hypothetical protein
MKSYWGSGGIVPRIIDLGTIWRSVVSFTPGRFTPRERAPWYPLDRKMGGLQSRSGRCGEEKNSQPLQGLESPMKPVKFSPHIHIFPLRYDLLSTELYRHSIEKLWSSYDNVKVKFSLYLTKRRGTVLGCDLDNRGFESR